MDLIAHPSRTRALLVLAAAAIAVFLAVYLLMVQTETGQDLDSAAHTTRVPTPGLGAGPASQLLKAIDVGAIVLGTALIAGVGLVRRGLLLALVPVLVIAGSLALAEILKHAVFERPDMLAVFDTNNSYPSGHTTIATAFGVAALLVVPAWLRPAVALGAFAYATAIGLASVAAGWHRPSDVVGAYLLTVAVAALVAAALRYLPRLGPPEDGRGPARPVPTAVALGVVAGVVLSVGFAIAYNGRGIDLSVLDRGFVAYAFAIPIAAGTVVAALYSALWGGEQPAPSLDPRG